MSLTYDHELARRVGTAVGTVRSLDKIWKTKHTSKPTKVLLYKTLVQSITCALFCTVHYLNIEGRKKKLEVFSGVFRGGPCACPSPPFQPTTIFMMVFLAVLLIFCLLKHQN